MTLESPRLLNSIGLILGMMGVIVIFVFGPPQPNLDEGVKRIVMPPTTMPDGRTASEHDADVTKLRARHSLMSKTGIALVFVGFAFQLWAVWV